ncbi:hypothetical protein FPV67DRAFT_1495641 [Lyophyllum atratum]|nr:hypothetical protein FPV67DRAFT_1495641 [Lyophyllum atratum]
MSNSHSDFVLPGLATNRHGPATLIVTLVYAYSRRWNRRRLEHHTYAFWDKVLSYLIADLEPNVFHIPQLSIHNPPSQYPDSSFRTDAGANGDETIPDFAIMGADATNWSVNSTTMSPKFPPLEKWRDVKIHSLKPLVIVELKRTATRSAQTVASFIDNLRLSISAAQVAAEDQAILAFEAFKELKEIILIAAAGEWWTFKHVRKGSLDKFQLEGLQDQLPYNQRQGKKGSKTKSKPQVLPFIRYTDLGPHEMETLKADVEDAMPETNQWSLNILFGTEVSNQRFYLIHHWLGEQRGEVGDPYDETLSPDELDVMSEPED